MNTVLCQFREDDSQEPIVREFPLMGLDPRNYAALLPTYDGFNHLTCKWQRLDNLGHPILGTVSSIHRNNLQVNYLAHGLIAIKHGLEL